MRRLYYVIITEIKNARDGEVRASDQHIGGVDMAILAQKQIEAFWGSIDKEHSKTFYNGLRCWEWMRGRDSDGYGVAWIGKKLRGTHRVAYELVFGEIQEGLHVLHHCDNPPCCNPDHLFGGTQKDNMNDKIQKGRQGDTRRKMPPHGELNGNHKLTDVQISEIRSRYGKYGKNGETTIALAKEFGVDKSHIWYIVNNKGWK